MLGLAADASISVPECNHKFQNKYCYTYLIQSVSMMKLA